MMPRLFSITCGRWRLTDIFAKAGRIREDGPHGVRYVSPEVKKPSDSEGALGLSGRSGHDSRCQGLPAAFRVAVPAYQAIAGRSLDSETYTHTYSLSAGKEY